MRRGADLRAAPHGADARLAQIAAACGQKVAALDESAPVARSLPELQAVHRNDAERERYGYGSDEPFEDVTDDAEGDTCAVCGPDCEAPAGYRIGGQVVVSEARVSTTCRVCGDTVCARCRVEDGDTDSPCLACGEDEDAQEIRPAAAPAAAKQKSVKSGRARTSKRGGSGSVKRAKPEAKPRARARTTPRRKATTR